MVQSVVGHIAEVSIEDALPGVHRVWGAAHVGHVRPSTSYASWRRRAEKDKTTKGGLAIDLAEVTLVSGEAVRVLALAETNGNRIEKRSCLRARMDFLRKGTWACPNDA